MSEDSSYEHEFERRLAEEKQKGIRRLVASGYGEYDVKMLKQLAQVACDQANQLGLMGYRVSKLSFDYKHFANSSDPLDNSIYEISFMVHEYDQQKKL